MLLLCVISVCQNSWMIMDGVCDDMTNTPQCLYDGGDCCLDSWSSTLLCSECKCYAESGTSTTTIAGKMILVTDCRTDIKVWIQTGCTGQTGYNGDGFCDDVTNKPECNYDGGDCCLEHVDTMFCNECKCYEESGNVTQECTHLDTAERLGDSICDDQLNNPRCNFDGNDCCEGSSYFGLCHACICFVDTDASKYRDWG